MRDERGSIAGPITIAEPFTLWGSILGDVTVVDGGKVYVRGSIHGNLYVEKYGRVHIHGSVSGSVRLARKTKVIISGPVGGDAVNKGGRLYVDEGGTIAGRIRSSEGSETKVHGRPDLSTPTASPLRPNATKTTAASTSSTRSSPSSGGVRFRRRPIFLVRPRRPCHLPPPPLAP